jgi:predicted nucleic acid-binding Zn ribbon protein
MLHSYYAERTSRKFHSYCALCANNVDESEGLWRTGAPHHKQWGGGDGEEGREGVICSHAIPNGENKTGRKEQEVL